MKSLFKKNSKWIISILIILGIIIIGIAINSKGTKTFSIEEQLAIGEKYLTELNYEKALAVYDKIISIDPQNIPAHIGLAKSYAGLSQPEEEQRVLKKGLKIGIKKINEGEDIKGLVHTLVLMLADSYMNTENYEEALQVLTEAYDVLPDNIIKDYIDLLLAPVEVSLPSGNYEGEQIISCTTNGSHIYYTLDGTTPSRDSKQYSSPIKIPSGKTTLTLITESKYGLLSQPLSYTYQISEKVEPTVTPTITAEPTITVEPTVTVEPTITPTITIAPTVTNEPTPTPFITEPTVTPKAAKSPTPVVELSPTAEPTSTPTPIPLPTSSPTPEPIDFSKTFQYEKGKTEVTITGLQDTTLTIIEIPSSIDSLPVTKIDDSAFAGQSKISEVTIPSSVKTIGNSAFYDCSNLKKITLPSALTKIGEETFSWCTSLTSVKIPSSVTSIGAEAFSSCSSLSNITLPSTLTTLSEYTFLSCTSLKSITLPKKLTTIYDGVFSGCTSLSSVELPSQINYIGFNAFSGCTKLKSVSIPAKLGAIESGAFEDCPNLTLTVISGSYAEEYAKAEGISYK